MIIKSMRDASRNLNQYSTRAWTSSHNYSVSAAERKVTYWKEETLTACRLFMATVRESREEWVAEWAIKLFMPKSEQELESIIKWYSGLIQRFDLSDKALPEFCGTILGFAQQALRTKKVAITPLNETDPAYISLSGEKPECKPGSKFDSNKRRFSLLPLESVNEVVDVLEFGAKKYAVDNWKQVPEARQRYYDAALRHIFAWFNGEKLDPETGKHHLAHGICCLTFLLWMDLKGKL